MPSPYGKKRLDDNTHSYSWMYVCQKKSRGRRICFDSTTNPGLDGWLSKDSFSENDCRGWLSDFLIPVSLSIKSPQRIFHQRLTIFLVLKRTKKTVSAKLLNFIPPPGFEVRDWCWGGGGGWLAAKEKVTLETAAAETAAAASSKSWIGFSRDKKVGNHFPIETAVASVGENYSDNCAIWL